MTQRIRPARPTDAAIVVAFNQRLALESEGKAIDVALLQAGVEAALADEAKCRYFLAEVDGAIVGQLGLTVEWSDWRNGWFWWVQSVFVEPAFRRQGTFRALFEHVRQLAIATPDVIGIRLYVEQHNDAGLRTYLSLGMENTGYQVLELYPLAAKRVEG